VKNNKIIYRNQIQKKYLNTKIENRLKIKFPKIFLKFYKDKNIPNNPFYTLNKNYDYKFNKSELLKFRKYKKVIIIGMGGSILGANAIYSFLKKKIKKEFLFIDNIDETKLEFIKKKKDLNKTLFIIISKSGNTIETLSNFFALNIVKKNTKNIIIISEKSNNFLYLYAKKMNIYHIEHKNYIGGRFSVFSETGIVPALLMGLDIKKFKASALNCFKQKNKLFLKNSSINMSNVLNRGKIKNLIFVNYLPELNEFFFWCQQLIAESLGKKNKGFLPFVSTAPRDHHSLLQLYLDGPSDKIFNIFSLRSKKKKNIINLNDNNFNFLKGKGLNEIKIAQKNALIQSLKKNKIPFREIEISEINEGTLGELFSYFMLETAIIGKLLNINPFDQPAVEEVKISTKQLLT
tara:strand:+ start:51 stop:1265 length:1215 start_codon:yes stop_codon:yes gene_type:complete